MPGLVPGIHAFRRGVSTIVGSQVKPGHDGAISTPESQNLKA
jgi:hypothetical protein